jgi:hypothetical protein
VVVVGCENALLETTRDREIGFFFSCLSRRGGTRKSHGHTTHMLVINVTLFLVDPARRRVRRNLKGTIVWYHVTIQKQPLPYRV